MLLVGERIERIKRIDVNRIFDNALREIEKFILDLNRDQLYDKGEIDVTSPGKREQYAPSTIRQKKRKAKYKKTEFVTLRWEGDFYDSFKIIIFKNEFMIAAKDLKWANWLEPNQRFANALGLTDENKSELRNKILPIILREIRNEL